MADLRKTENFLIKAIRLGLYFLLLAPFVISQNFFYPFVHGKVFYFLAVSETVIWLYFVLCLINHSWRPRLRGINFGACRVLAGL
ncbi:MAG: hypothetical protein AAB731_00230, partial [Patescibacteria group bacterium]